MTMKILKRIVWLGRSTATMMGIAVMVAVVLGASTTALAAVPGDPFELGQINTIDRLTALVGATNNPMLSIDNNNGGANATALDLQVDPGKAPMKVNSATRVARLNADRLDGQDAPLLVRVNSDGTLGSDDTVAKVKHSPNSGYYQLDFLDRAVVGCVFQATLVNGPDGGEIAVYPSSALVDRLTVITTRNGLDFNARYDRDFHLVVYC